MEMLRIVDEKSGVLQCECTLESFCAENAELDELCVIACCLRIGEFHVEDFGAGGVTRIERVS